MTSSAERIIRLGFGFAISQALRVVIELDIADKLIAGERSVDDLAGQTGSDPDALYRIMRVLAGERVFCEISARCFELTELSTCLRSDQGSSPRDLVRMLNQEPYLAFAQLCHSVRTGQPSFDQVFGKPRFDWLADHPIKAATFQRAMLSLSQGSNEAVAEAYDFGPFSSVVDVGGGHGQLLSAILSRNPHLSGLLFDLPSAIDAAKECAGGDLGETSYVAGNFFDFVPAGADVYVLKKVIHDWNDERAALILCRCREAMNPEGRILVAETVLSSGNEPDTIKLVDANMLVVTGGAERTVAQYAKLFAAAGLRLERAIPTAQRVSLLEGVRV